MTFGPLEREVRGRFDVRAERFAHAGLELDLLLPRSADALIDTSEANVDERLPYWADLWPSARALARRLLERPPAPVRTLELGSGVALPSLVLRHLGVPVVATDWYDDALLFARVNAERNGLGPLETAHLDWRDPPAGLGRFGRVVAADVLYEKRNVDALAALLPRLLEPGGSVLLADPGRMHTSEFETRVRADGWTLAAEEVRREPSPWNESEVIGSVRILRFLPPQTPQRPPPKT